MSTPVRATGAWIALTILTALLVCAAVVTLHLFHNHALERSGEIIRELRQARVDLAEGVLHATLGDAPGSPWDRAQGEALLAQALAQFERSLARLPSPPRAPRLFTRRLGEFKALLAAGPTRGATSSCAPPSTTSCAPGVQVDAEARKSLLAIREEQDRLFLAVLGGSALLLALLVAGTIVTARRQSRAERSAAAHASASRRSSPASPVAAGIVAYADGRLLAVNDALCELLGASREALLASTVPQTGAWADAKQYAEFLERLRAERRVTNFEMGLRRAGGELRECLVSAERVEFLGQPRPARAPARHHRAQALRGAHRLPRYARRPHGTANRRRIEDQIAQAITHSRRTGRQAAVLFVDLDRFKVVNDGYGRALGDALLKAAASGSRAPYARATASRGCTATNSSCSSTTCAARPTCT
jgi:PAS domain S-box-containing protein